MRVKRPLHQAELFDAIDQTSAELPEDADEASNTSEALYIIKSNFKDNLNGKDVLFLPDVRLMQRQFNELHEEIYRKGGVKPANAAIDEVGKLIFLKVHTEKFPDYRLHEGSAKDKLFTEIFNPDYIRENGKKAVREMQDAFKEISVLECYLSQFAGSAQAIFPYQEPLRLEHPDVLALAVEILSPLSLSVLDDRLLSNVQKQWETFAHQDLPGSAYDVFLRGKYDSAGGLGTYLTPNQVVDCIVDMAFSHITDAQLWAGEIKDNSDIVPSFLMGDICCCIGWKVS
jgi:type I restriction enzyme M protein